MVQVGLEQVALQIGVGAHPPRLLQVAPGALGRALGLGERPVPLGAPELRLHIDQLALVQPQLLLQRRQLALQHPHALAMLRGEPRGHRHRLPVLNLARQAAAPLGVGQALALDGQLALGARHGGARLLHRHLRLHHRLPHPTRQIAQIPGRRRRVEGGAQGVPQALEHEGALALSDGLREER